MTMLGVRSHFSLGESTLSPEAIKKSAADSEQSQVVVCDTMTVNAMIQTSKLADESFDPRFGVALRVVSDITIRDKKDRQPIFFPKVFPCDWNAVQVLFRAISEAHAGDNFYMVPRMSRQMFFNMLADGDFIVTTGDFYGTLEMKDAETLCEAMSNSAKDFYVELSPVPTGYHDRVNAIGANLVAQKDYKPLLSWPTMYEKGSHETFVINRGIQKRSSYAKKIFLNQPVHKEYHAPTALELVDLVKSAAGRIEKIQPGSKTVWKQAILNQKSFFDSLEYKWEKQPISLPNLAADPDQRLKELCVQGLKVRMANDVFGERISSTDYKTEYIPRLKYELGILKDMGFAEYFLLVDDLVRWCKSNGILVGPGRGSVGGSLVAYLMGITDVDPIRFGLIFERFINPSRKDLPDIDLDFMSTRRHEVIEYLIERFGEDKVAGISNYGVIGSASAIKDVGRVFNLEVSKLAVSKFIPKIHGQAVDLETAVKQVAEISQLADDYPEMWKHALKLQGNMRTYGRHAAGTIVAGVPISDLAIVENRKGERTINWDMRVAESMGLVKLDILGLSTLDTIARTLDNIKSRHSKSIDILSIPLDDDKTLQAFSEGRTIGVFQFEGGAARRLLKDMSRRENVNFNDIVAANALNRPGPIDAGLVDKYVDAKNGDAYNDLPHPNMAEALKETYNVIAYQEQIMRVAVDLSNFSLADADILRKAMGKKDKKLMAELKDQFVEGAESHSGMDPMLAGDLWEEIEVFAGYAFNKSHAAEYSLISYQCMWLKTHYPVEFYAAALSTVNEDKLKPILKDALESGVEVLPPDINASEIDFVIANDTTLITPFNRVKRCAGKAPEIIMSIRAEGKIKSIEDLRKRLTEKKLGRWCNKRVLENLNAVGAFAHVEPGQEPPLADSRIRSQLELMPGLVTRVLHVDELIPNDKHTKARIVGIVRKYSDEDEDAVHCSPGFGKKAAFMAVTDCPTWSEEADKMFAKGKSFNFTKEAMSIAGINANDGYWTGVLKRIKDDRMISPEEIKTYAPYLTQEVELLKPQLIITLGSTAARTFIPELKGGIMDHVGSTHYLPKINATVLIGFNPAMIFHDRDKLDDLADVMKKAAEIIGK